MNVTLKPFSRSDWNTYPCSTEFSDESPLIGTATDPQGAQWIVVADAELLTLELATDRSIRWGYYWPSEMPDSTDAARVAVMVIPNPWDSAYLWERF